MLFNQADDKRGTRGSGLPLQCLVRLFGIEDNFFISKMSNWRVVEGFVNVVFIISILLKLGKCVSDKILVFSKQTRAFFDAYSLGMLRVIQSAWVVSLLGYCLSICSDRYLLFSVGITLMDVFWSIELLIYKSSIQRMVGTILLMVISLF